MSKFIPQKGMYFYIFYKPREVVVAGHLFDADRVVTKTDTSYRGKVFLCKGSDSCYVVGEEHSRPNDAPYMFTIRDVDFEPIGPEIAAALNIVMSDET